MQKVNLGSKVVPIMDGKVGVVGYGYWGPNLVRNFYEASNCEVLYCCDRDKNKLRIVNKRYPSIITTDNYQDLLKDKNLDAVIIATPTETHYQLAKEAIKYNKDVLVEKPLASSYREAAELVKLAGNKRRILMVDHTFLFNEAVRKIKNIIDSGSIGDILYIDSTRANLGLFAENANVVFDLAVHDFSIIQYLLGKEPKYIQAFGKSHYNKQEDVSYVYIEYPKNIFVHINVSWLSPLKIRQMVIVGTKKMIVYDEVDQLGKVKLFDKGVSLEKGLTRKLEESKISYRSGDMWLPNIKGTEPLSTLASEFIEAITKRKKPVSDGALGKTVVNLSEKANLSMHTGKKVKLF